MFSKTLNRDITIGVKTRKIMREVNEELMKGVIVTDFSGQVDFPAINADKSEELLIKLLTGLTQAEIDSITEEEYLELKAEINKKK